MAPAMLVLLVGAAGISSSVGHRALVHHDTKDAKNLRWDPRQYWAPTKTGKADDLSSTHYPKDSQPHAVPVEFGHPFPMVKDSGNYDYDYVKDSNDDKGEWKAQTEYDRLRRKVMKEKDDLTVALKDERKENKDLDDAIVGEKMAEKKANDAAKVAQKAKDEADAAGYDWDHITGSGPSIGNADSIPMAEDHVKAAADNLEDCKKALEEAEARLRALQETTKQNEEYKTQAEAHIKYAEDMKAQALSKDDLLKHGVGKENMDHEDALKSYKQELKDVEKAEAQLKKAAERLAHYREKNHGIEAKPMIARVQSFALRSSSAPSALAILGFAALALAMQ